MRECTGQEICEEWLYHLGVPVEEIPELRGSVYDIRDLLNATVALRDGKRITDLQLGFIQDIVLKAALKRIKGTEVEKLMKKCKMI